jgi:GNAT superfamily N-acetyltransferase
MGTALITVATAADLPALGPDEFFAHHLHRPDLGVLLVAWHDGRPVGDVFVRWSFAQNPRIHERYPGVPVLDHLEVTPALRRRGIGTSLVHAAERAIRDRDSPLAMLLVEVDNPDAARLYRRLGYVDWECGTVGDCNVMIKLMDEGVPGLDAWRPWHPREVAERLAGVRASWHVAGGWALDLWRGTQTRAHADLEIAIPRADFPALRERLAGFVLYAVEDGRLRPLAPGEPPPDEVHQVWVCEPAMPAWRMDIFLEPGDPTTWVYRRDERLRAPYPRMVAHDGDGVPYLRPEAALLYKAKRPRPKDEADFAAAIPRLDAGARRWLAGALPPDHAWLARLGTLMPGAAD